MISYLFKTFISYFYLLYIIDIYNDSLTRDFFFNPISTPNSCMAGYSFYFIRDIYVLIAILFR